MILNKSVLSFLHIVRPRSFARDLLQQFLIVDLIDQRFAVGLDPMISNDTTPRVQGEAAETGSPLDVSNW